MGLEDPFRMPLSALRRVLPLLAFAACGLLASNASADEPDAGSFGLGATLGSPTGASAKLFVAPKQALQLDVGWGPLHHGDGRAHLDYLFHQPFSRSSAMTLSGYLGLGAGAAFWVYDPVPFDYRPRNDDPKGVALYGRLPFGLTFHWKRVPLDTAIELAWAPYLVPFDPARGDFAVKVRYYF